MRWRSDDRSGGQKVHSSDGAGKENAVTTVRLGRAIGIVQSAAGNFCEPVRRWRANLHCSPAVMIHSKLGEMVLLHDCKFSQVLQGHNSERKHAEWLVGDEMQQTLAYLVARFQQWHQRTHHDRAWSTTSWKGTSKLNGANCKVLGAA